MAKEQLLGTHKTPELADEARMMASGMGSLLGSRLKFEVRPRYDLVAIRGNGVVAHREIKATDKSEFTCRFDHRTFGSRQALATHMTRAHHKGKK